MMLGCTAVHTQNAKVMEQLTMSPTVPRPRGSEVKERLPMAVGRVVVVVLLPTSAEFWATESWASASENSVTPSEDDIVGTLKRFLLALFAGGGGRRAGTLGY